MQHAATGADDAARLIGRIGAAAARAPLWVSATAPAWSGMTAAERATLATTVIDHGDAAIAIAVLKDLESAGRATLTVQQRAAPERRAQEAS